MKKRTPRIMDVAAAAGVSTATVSRALSAPDRLSEATRASVLDAIAATGYRVNRAARNLRQRRTGGIVVLVPNLANPFFSQILAGIAAGMAPSGYNVLIADTRQSAEARARIHDYLHDTGADGLIVLDADLPEEVLAAGETATRHPPIVFACEWVDADPRATVTIDNRLGARLAIDHLAALGHRRIGHLAGPDGNILTETRREAARAAIAAHGLELREDWFFSGDFSLGSGAAAARRWLDMADRPGAVFCASDAMACGFIGALHQAGTRVPGDVSVVGFDDIEIAGHFVPALTTIAQPRLAIGARAAETLLALLAGGNDPAAASSVLPVELVVRESSAPPRG